MIPLKLVLTYYALYVFLKEVLNEKKHFIFPFLRLLALTAVCVVLYRIVDHYLVSTFIYHGSAGPSTLFGVMNIWYALFDIGPAAVIALIIKFVRIQFGNREKERTLVKEKLEAELRLLRNQINPRFLFNTLDNIYALSLKRSDDTPEVIMELSKFLNFMLYESRKEMIIIGDEMRILDDYIGLERIWRDGTPEIDFICEIDNEMEQIPPSLLLSFVDNVFEHAASRGHSGTRALIDIKLQSGILRFNIEHILDVDTRNASGCYDNISSSRRQIELLYTDYHLDIDDQKEYFKVDLVINLKSYAKI